MVVHGALKIADERRDAKKGKEGKERKDISI